MLNNTDLKHLSSISIHVEVMFSQLFSFWQIHQKVNSESDLNML